MDTMNNAERLAAYTTVISSEELAQRAADRMNAGADRGPRVYVRPLANGRFAVDTTKGFARLARNFGPGIFADVDAEACA